MATNNFVYWSDGLEGRTFDHHRRNGGRGICQQKLPAGPGIWTIFSKLVKTSHHALIQSNILITLVLSNFICFNLATIYESPVQNICVYILKFIGNRNVCGQMHAWTSPASLKVCATLPVHVIGQVSSLQRRVNELNWASNCLCLFLKTGMSKRSILSREAIG